VRVSVVTPSFRCGPWLRLCVASVADQGVAVEHIVQDAGSDDGTLEWLRTDRRVRLFVEPDRGMYDALNRGLRRATGEVCAYLNCDEQYLPGALAAVTQYFATHPAVDVLFGDVVVVNGAGDYVCHRKMLLPRLAHTWVCHLATLSCAMFFRRRLVAERGFFFSPEYRCGGDGEWMVRLLRAKVPMAVLRRFTSVFTLTGENLSRAAEARREWGRLRATAPRWMRAAAPLLVLHHRLRRWLGGSYRQPPFRYALYTLTSPERRVLREVSRPTGRWPA